MITPNKLIKKILGRHFINHTLSDIEHLKYKWNVCGKLCMVQSLSKHVCNKYQQQFQTADFKQTHSKYTSLVRKFFVQLFMRTNKRISFFHCTPCKLYINLTCWSLILNMRTRLEKKITTGLRISVPIHETNKFCWSTKSRSVLKKVSLAMESSIEKLAAYHITSDMGHKPHCTLHILASNSPYSLMNQKVYYKFFSPSSKASEKILEYLKSLYLHSTLTNMRKLRKEWNRTRGKFCSLVGDPRNAIEQSSSDEIEF